jgi:hypothetical protein
VDMREAHPRADSAAVDVITPTAILSHLSY